MAIQINYSSASASGNASLGILRANGLKAYFAEYESTFTQTHPGGTPVTPTTNAQWFSHLYSSDVTYDGTTYSGYVADLQYAGLTLTAGKYSAFIAESKTVANGAAVGQLVYWFNDHTLFGDLDKVSLGEVVGPTPSASPTTPSTYSMTRDVVSFTNLDSVLNAGLDSGGHVISRTSTTDTNDTHEIVYGLMGGATNTNHTQPLQGYLNANDLDHNGTAYGEVFDGFNDNDLFRIGGGADQILGFDPSEDTVNLGGLYGYGTATDAYNAMTNTSFTINGVLYTGAYLESQDFSHSVFFAGVSKGSLSSLDILLV